jgi:Fe-S cluster assembly protein SufD
MVRPKMVDRSQSPPAYSPADAASAPAADASVQHYLGEFDAFIAALTAEPAPLTALRREAIARFARLGFPTTKNEDWHFTSVAPIAAGRFRRSRAADDPGSLAAELEAHEFGHPEWPTLVFLNGHAAPELSRLSVVAPGVALGALRPAIDRGDDIVTRWLGRVTDFRTAAFTALNTAFFTDGAVLHVPRATGLDAPIHLIFISTVVENEVVAHPRNLIVLERGARATVVESYISIGAAHSLTNAVTEIVIGDGARLDHIKIQREAIAAFHVGTSDARQGRDSTYHSFSYATGSDLSRSNVYTLLDGEGATVTMNGLYMVDGTQHVDHQTRIEHVQPNCTSHELYKGVLDGRAHAVFNGKVYVHPAAQKTDGKQSNNNLLLSPDARVDTKPQLEIFADDVKCTHGATVGRLDDQALFYFRSRGIPGERARTLLTYAFAAEVLEEIELEPVRDELERLVLQRVTAE